MNQKGKSPVKIKFIKPKTSMCQPLHPKLHSQLIQNILMFQKKTPDVTVKKLTKNQCFATTSSQKN